MRSVLGLHRFGFGVAFLVMGALVGGACSSEDAASSDEDAGATDAATDASVRPGSDAGGTTSTTDSGSKTDSASPSDAGASDAAVTDAAPDAADAAANCTQIGKTCDPDDTFSCPFLWDCVPASPAPIVGGDAGDASVDAADASADASADAAVDAGPPAYVCLPLNLASADCNNGVDTCATGSCLLAAGRCLSPEEATCVCAAHPGACAP